MGGNGNQRIFYFKIIGRLVSSLSLVGWLEGQWGKWACGPLRGWVHDVEDVAA